MPANRKNISETHHNRHHASPVGFGIVTYRRGGRFGPRRQMDYQLVVIHRGGLGLTVDGREHTVSAGQGILLQPHGEEVFRFSTEEETTHSWCQIPREMIPPGMEFPPDVIARAGDCDGWLLGTMKDGWKLPGDVMTVAGRQMMAAAVLMAMWGFCRATSEQGRAERPRPDALERVRHAIEQRLAEELTLEDLARAGGVSVGHLIKLAKEHWGMTPMERCWRERAEAGARLLRETGLSIGEIAYRTGFSNPFHFSRRFKQRYGQHPRAWRQGAWGMLRESSGSSRV